MDSFFRYFPAKKMLDRLGPDAKILEVGANDAGIARVFPGVKFTALDRDFAGDPPPGVARVRGSADRIPFPDAAFDAVLCVEVFEHLPKKIRADAAREIARVARRAAILTFPAGEKSSAAEARIDATREKLLGGRDPWLREHLERGLPDPAEIAEIFRDAGFSVRVLPNFWLPAWELYQKLRLRQKSIAARPRPGFFGKIFLKLFEIPRVAARIFYPFLNFAPAYRAVILAEKSG